MTGQERCRVPGCGAPMDGLDCTAQLSRERVRAQARQRLHSGPAATSFEQARTLAGRVRRVLDSAYGYATERAAGGGRHAADPGRVPGRLGRCVMAAQAQADPPRDPWDGVPLGAVAIPLTQGLRSLIDAVDAPVVTGFRWRASWSGRLWYAKRHARKPDGKWTSQYLHTLITGYAKTDHINGDALDNRRRNLRPADITENNRNRRKVRGVSRFKGVALDKRDGIWAAHITVDWQPIYLGRYRSEEAAARAYDAGARKFYGEFASLNFPEPGENGCLPTPGDKPHPAGPNGPRAELDQLTGPLLAGTTAWGRWVRELSDCPDPPASDVLVEARRVARRVAALGRVSTS